MDWFPLLREAVVRKMMMFRGYIGGIRASRRQFAS